MEWKESGMNGKWGISSLYRRGQVNQSSSLMHAFTCLSESAAESVTQCMWLYSFRQVGVPIGDLLFAKMH